MTGPLIDLIRGLQSLQRPDLQPAIDALQQLLNHPQDPRAQHTGQQALAWLRSHPGASQLPQLRRASELLRNSLADSGTQAAPAAGAWLGPYPLLRELGEGGAGKVYLSRDPQSGAPLALKALRAREAIALLDEARAAARLDDPACVRTLTAFQDPATGTPVLVTEYLEGGDLRGWLDGLKREDWPVSPRSALLILEQVARALAATHAAKVTHQDLKPDNLLLTGEGRARLDEALGFEDREAALEVALDELRDTSWLKLSDFGLALMREKERAQGGASLSAASLSGASLSGGSLSYSLSQIPAHKRGGTLVYMPPEQLGGLGISRRADIFAAGLIFYELLTGQPPREARRHAEGLEPYHFEDVQAFMAILISAPAASSIALSKDPALRRLDAHPSLLQLLEALGARDKARRPSARALLDELDALLDLEDLRRPGGRVWPLAAAAGLLVAGAAVAVAAMLPSALTRPPPAPPAPPVAPVAPPVVDEPVPLPSPGPEAAAPALAPLTEAQAAAQRYASLSLVGEGALEWAPVLLRLDRAAAERLAASGEGGLRLDRVAELNPEAAAALAASPTLTRLSLGGLRHLSREAARALMAKRWELLRLDGLAELDLGVAQILAEAEALALPRVTELTPALAASLARRGAALELDGLRRLDPETAAAFAGAGDLSLGALEVVSLQVWAALERHSAGLSLGGLRVLPPDQPPAPPARRAWLRLPHILEVSEEQAAALSACARRLELPSLEGISAPTLASLAQVEALRLGVPALPPGAAQALGGGRLQRLELPSLRRLSEASAAELAALGCEFELPSPARSWVARARAEAPSAAPVTGLEGVTRLDLELANELRGRPEVALPALQTASPEALAVLATSEGVLELGLTELSPEQERALARRGRLKTLRLDNLRQAVGRAELMGAARLLALGGLRSLPRADAAWLAGRATALELGGVEALPEELAQELAGGRLTGLSLPGLAGLEPRAAGVLAGLRSVELGGLTRLTVELAEAFAKGPGPAPRVLTFKDLRRVEPGALRALVSSSLSAVIADAALIPRPQLEELEAATRGGAVIFWASGPKPEVAAALASLPGTALLVTCPEPWLDAASLEALSQHAGARLVNHADTAVLSVLQRARFEPPWREAPDPGGVINIDPPRLPALDPQSIALARIEAGELAFHAGLREFSDGALEALARGNAEELMLPFVTRLEMEDAAKLASLRRLRSLELDGVSALSPAALSRLAAAPQLKSLSLNGLRALSPQQASALASGQLTLRLAGLTALSPEAAAALAPLRGTLSLPRLREPSALVIAALAGSPASLDLPAVTRLDAEGWRALSAHEGWASLPGVERLAAADLPEEGAGRARLELGLRSLEPEAARRLARLSGELALPKLEAIAAPALRELARGRSQLFLDVRALDEESAAVLAEAGLKYLSVPKLRRISEAALATLAGSDIPIIHAPSWLEQRLILLRHQRATTGAGPLLSAPPEGRLVTISGARLDLGSARLIGASRCEAVRLLLAEAPEAEALAALCDYPGELTLQAPLFDAAGAEAISRLRGRLVLPTATELPPSILTPLQSARLPFDAPALERLPDSFVWSFARRGEAVSLTALEDLSSREALQLAVLGASRLELALPPSDEAFGRLGNLPEVTISAPLRLSRAAASALRDTLRRRCKLQLPELEGVEAGALALLGDRPLDLVVPLEGIAEHLRDLRQTRIDLELIASRSHLSAEHAASLLGAPLRSLRIQGRGFDAEVWQLLARAPYPVSFTHLRGEMAALQTLEALAPTSRLGQLEAARAEARIAAGESQASQALRRLTPEVAATLAGLEIAPEELVFARLQELSAEAASALVKARCERLAFPGLRRLSPEAARVLATWEGQELCVDGLPLGPEAYAALLGYKGTLRLRGLRYAPGRPEGAEQARVVELDLRGLESLEPRAAAALPAQAHLRLDLDGLSAEVLATLAARPGRTSFSGASSLGSERLRSIPEALEGARWSFEALSGLDPAAAVILGRCCAELSLPRLMRIDEGVARGLAPIKGALRLGVPTLTEAVAAILAERPGPLALPALTSLSDEAIAALARRGEESMEMPRDFEARRLALIPPDPEAQRSLAMLAGVGGGPMTEVSLVLRSLEPALAAKVARSRHGSVLMPGLAEASAETLRALASYRGALTLGLRELDAERAEILTSYQAKALHLPELARIRPEALPMLAKMPPGEKLAALTELTPALAALIAARPSYENDRLRALSPEAAVALTSGALRSLSLPGLADLAPGVLASLIAIESLRLDGLRTLNKAQAQAYALAPHPSDARLSLRGLQAIEPGATELLGRAPVTLELSARQATRSILTELSEHRGGLEFHAEEGQPVIDDEVLRRLLKLSPQGLALSGCDLGRSSIERLAAPGPALSWSRGLTSDALRDPEAQPPLWGGRAARAELAGLAPNATALVPKGRVLTLAAARALVSSERWVVGDLSEGVSPAVAATLGATVAELSFVCKPEPLTLWGLTRAQKTLGLDVNRARIDAEAARPLASFEGALLLLVEPALSADAAAALAGCRADAIQLTDAELSREAAARLAGFPGSLIVDLGGRPPPAWLAGLTGRRGQLTLVNPPPEGLAAALEGFQGTRLTLQQARGLQADEVAALAALATGLRLSSSEGFSTEVYQALAGAQEVARVEVPQVRVASLRTLRAAGGWVIFEGQPEVLGSEALRGAEGMELLLLSRSGGGLLILTPPIFPPDEASAEVLAAHPGPIALRGFAAFPNAPLTPLLKHRGGMFVDFGRGPFDEARAARLASYGGDLGLRGLLSLPPSLAQALSGFKGDSLAVELDALSAQAAAAIAPCPVRLSLNSSSWSDDALRALLSREAPLALRGAPLTAEQAALLEGIPARELDLQVEAVGEVRTLLRGRSEVTLRLTRLDRAAAARLAASGARVVIASLAEPDGRALEALANAPNVILDPTVRQALILDRSRRAR